jgi:methyl-accepting chemotaxis protein
MDLLEARGRGPHSGVPAMVERASADGTRTRRVRFGWFWNRPIGLKVASAVGLLSVVFVVVGGGGAVALWHAGVNLQAMSTRMSEQTQLSTLAAEQVRSHALAARAAATTDQGARATILADWTANDALVDQQIAAFDGQSADSQHWSDFVAGWQQWTAFRDSTVLPAVQSGDLVRVSAALAAPAADPDLAGTPLAAAQAQSDTAVEQILASGRHEISTVIIILMVAFVVGAVATGLLTVTVTRRITRALGAVERTLATMADGDLTTPVVVEARDEAGRMAEALARMQASLRQTLSRVIDAAGRVSVAATSLTEANDRAAGSTRQTSDGADQLAASAELVSRNVQTVAAGAAEIHESIAEIATNASSAASVAHQATQAARSANDQVARLGESSRQIDSVVKVITAVAEQTNLLALNATIEAARAGEAGKGFAVVAGEVKQLAQETARATKDIASRIEAIQRDTGGAVHAIEEIGTIVDSINDYQTTIAAAVEEQAATTTEMSRGVGEAAAGSERIAGSISGVARSADASAVVVDQVRAQVDELTAAAQELRTVVSGYVTTT